nr:hypothetical protein [Tanacetum cinerariifolium]
MEDGHFDTIPATESDDFIKSSVENLVPIPSESEDESECDVPDCDDSQTINFSTFSNPLFDDFTSSDDESSHDEDIHKMSFKTYSNPFFDLDEEIISSVFNPIHNEDLESTLKNDQIISDNSNVDIESFSPYPILNEDSASHMEEIDLFLNPDDPMPSNIEEDDDDSERDIPIFEELPNNYSLSLPNTESYHFDIPSPYRPPVKPPDGNTGTLNIKMMGDVSDQKVPIPRLTITRILNQEKSPDLLSHLGFKAFQPSAECPMIINGKNTPLLDVPLFHFYPLDQLKYGGN